MKKSISLLFFSAIGCCSFAQSTNKPNIVVIIADDCMYQDLGCYGSNDAITPNIDKLASEGMRFTNFHQSTAMSSPTRHCIMTGLYPFRSGAYPNHTRVFDGTKSIVHYLKDLDYRLALQGKRHIAPVSSFPFEYLGKQQEYYNEELIDGFIDDATTKNEPFCLFFCSHNSHTPWNQGDTSLFDKDKITLPPYLVDTDVTRESYVKYLAEINALDDEVGKLLAVLDRYDIVDNTIVLFTSEQGHSFPFAKWTCYGSGLRTAVIMRYPDVIKAGVETDAMCEYVDVVPTLIDLVGGEVPTDIDGKSFIKVVKGKTDRHKKYTFSQHTTCGINSGSDYYGIRSVYDGEYRYVLNLTPEVKFCNILTADRKEDSIFASWLLESETNTFAKEQVERYQIRPKEEFYVLDDDAYEMKNQINNIKYQKDIDRLRRTLYNWMLEQGDKGQETELKARERM